MNNSTTIKTRVAPSPTGYLHLGLARTALFNYLFARQHGGTFILRIEDTDKARSRAEYEQDITEQLIWLGLTPDASCRQSDRVGRHTEVLESLISSGAAYVSKEPAKDGSGGTKAVVRLVNPGGTVSFTDLIRGTISADVSELGDFVIARSLTDPLYHLAVVVDDEDMGITHVIRGEDHISNTPRQILIQRALGFKEPHYAHLPLILGQDRRKLSKRSGAASVRELREEGYLPEALVNYLVLLGWHPEGDEEILSLSDMLRLFDITNVQKGGAIFDKRRLDWVNRAYMDKMTEAEFKAKAASYLPDALARLPQYSPERLSRALPVIRERADTFGEIRRRAEEGEYDFFFSAPHPDPSLLPWKSDSREAAKKHLLYVSDCVSKIDDAAFSRDALERAIHPYAEREGKGSVLWPMRVALSGRERSPDPYTLAAVLGKTETLSRLKAAHEAL